jgi:hypothetical protein
MTMRILVLAAALAMAASVRPVLADEPSKPAVPESKAPSLKDITQWVKDLDADRFLIRESATENLIESAYDAVAPLLEALPGSSLEVTTRGIYVLRELALSGDASTEEAAERALGELAAPRGTSVSRRAATTLAMLGEIRQTRVLGELEQLGAGITTETTQVGLQFEQDVNSIEIGENWKGTQQNLRRLKWLGNVQKITLIGPQITDDTLKHVQHMSSLKVVIIKRAGITDAAMASLKDLKNLRQLDVMYSRIGDESVDDLKVHTSASLLKLYGTDVTKQGADRLQEALATTKVDFRRGAFLGVGCQTHPLGCAIAIVHPNSAAARAGLMPGDIIVKYGDKEVPDFETLTGMIGGNRPGDTISLEIQHGDESSVKKITLGEWE